eukprot:scaffold89717_cov30-Phaeocystis_antarctica.AAC.1
MLAAPPSTESMLRASGTAPARLASSNTPATARTARVVTPSDPVNNCHTLRPLAPLTDPC